MRKQIIILILPILFSCASNSNQKLDIPYWYLNPPINQNQYMEVGFGSSKHEAMINALDNLLRIIQFDLRGFPEETRHEVEIDGVMSFESVSRSLIFCTFGKITFENSFRDYLIASETKSNEINENTTVLTYKSTYPIVIKSHESAFGLGKEAKSESHFEIIPNKKNLESVYQELDRNGIKVLKEKEVNNIIKR